MLLLFRALAHLGGLRDQIAIVCCGGRPTLEPELAALAGGTPVIAAPAPAVVEVCGDAAIYVPPRNPAVLAREVARVLGSETLRAACAARGAARAARFSWTTMAANIAAFLRSLPAPTATP